MESEVLHFTTPALDAVGALKEACSMASTLKHHGYTAKQLRKAGFSVAAIKSVWPSVTDLREAGFSAEALQADGFTATALKKGGYSSKILKRVGLYSASDLRKAGFSASALKESGHSFHDLLEGGFQSSALKKMFPIEEREKQEPVTSLRNPGVIRGNKSSVSADRDHRCAQLKDRTGNLCPSAQNINVVVELQADAHSHDHDSAQNMDMAVKLQESLDTESGVVVESACVQKAQSHDNDSAQSLPEVSGYDYMKTVSSGALASILPTFLPRAGRPFDDLIEAIEAGERAIEDFEAFVLDLAAEVLLPDQLSELDSFAFGKEQGASAYHLKHHKKKQRRTALQQQPQRKQHQRFRPREQRDRWIVQKELHNDTCDLRKLL
jgi:hypothetical protein